MSSRTVMYLENERKCAPYAHDTKLPLKANPPTTDPLPTTGPPQKRETCEERFRIVHSVFQFLEKMENLETIPITKHTETIVQ